MSPKSANLLANQSGEGAPIAPDGWRWRAGNRKQDMYFTAPSGEVFRSRCKLKEHLKAMENPPSQDAFCWSITEEVLQHPAMQFAVPESATRQPDPEPEVRQPDTALKAASGSSSTTIKSRSRRKSKAKRSPLM